MERYGIFGTDINTFATLGAGQACSALGDTFSIQRKGRAGFRTEHAAYTFFSVDPDFKDVELIGERLEGAEWTEKAALSSAFR